MLQPIDSCPLCKSKDQKEARKVKDFSVSQEIFKIHVCQHCGLNFTSPVPDQESIGSYYESDTYISHTDKGNSVVNRIYKLVRNYTLSKKIDLLINLKIDSLLDIGCGTGHFLNKARKNNFEIDGIETDNNARLLAQQLVNKEIFNSISALPADKSYSAITLWHVLEHIHNLEDSLKTIIDRLQANGYLILALPNFKSYDAKHYNNFWAAWDVPRHLYHFSPEQIKYIAEKHNLLIYNTLPMYFDSFYVSMLSEKYKNRPLILQIIYGIVFGFLSNFKASKKRYSSQIYVLRKKS